MRTRADPRGGSWIINGSKTFITNAPIADLFVVFASTDPSRGFASTSAFLVARSATGLTAGAPFHKMGMCPAEFMLRANLIFRHSRP